MKKILVPTDFSTPAGWAFETAIAIAKKAKGEILLLHVIEEPTDQSFNAEAQVHDEEGWEEKIFTLKLIKRSDAQLESLRRHAEDEGVPVKTILRIGNTFHGIKSILLEQRADLIVMGTFGATKLEEMLVGSLTEKVIRYAKCPVLTIHEKPLANEFKNIVYATNLSGSEYEFADVVKTVQALWDASVHIVRINTPMNFQPDHITKKSMKAFVSHLGLNRCTTNIFNDKTEEDGILRFASDINADLIVMATHGRTGIAHVLAGSIAEEVSGHSIRPVLTYCLKRS